jgi:hypothetical protein
MKFWYTIVTLAPTPLFLLGFVYSLFTAAPQCGTSDYSMSAMWLIMALAHTPPWILRCQQLYLARHT